MAFEDDGVSVLRVVSATDPAIDDAKTDRRRYAETRDAGLLHFRHGHRPRWWVCKPLSANDIMGVLKNPTPESKFATAVMLALEAVEGHEADGGALRPTHRVTDSSGGERVVWDERDFQRLVRGYGFYVTIFEIGCLIYERAGRGNAWAGGAGFFTVLPVLSDELAAIGLRHAGSTPSAPTEPSG